ncbi:MAG TPA: amidohydrolase family protein [Xanthomonadales bacterium]|nr:amidohydrolase family protein [Xanthomonadales bacterium]
MTSQVLSHIPIPGKLAGLTLLSVLFLTTSSLFAAEYREYSWLTVGEPSGSLTVNHNDDASISIDFEFNDRGRGPNTSTKIWLDQRGYPIHLHVTGNNYSGGEVDERFEVLDRSAEWSSNVDSGSVPASDAGFYTAHNSNSETLAMLARALLGSDSGSVELLPSGTASISTVTSKTINQDGESLDITLYAIQGLGASPTHVWLDQDQQLFGVDYAWFAITRKGWESHFSLLKAEQEKATLEFFESLARDLTEDSEDMLVIDGARIFDSVEGDLTDPATVFSWKGKISAIYFEEVEIPEQATVIDGSGQVLMPSLWDMHGHVGIESFLNYTASGVSNVRDMANDPDNISQLRDQVGKGLIIGPDVYALGFIDKRGEFSAPTGMLADSMEEARELIDWYSRRGFFGIKLYSSIEPEWVAPLAAYAHERDLVVMGHVPAYMNATQAIEAGYNEITHINMIMLNFLGAEELDTRTPTRFIVPGEQGGELDLNSPQVRDFIAMMIERDVSHDPTISIFMDSFLNEPGKISWTFREIDDHLPASVRRDAIAGVGRNDGNEGAWARSAETMLELVKLLHDSGVKLVPGTDNMLPGFTLIRELMYYAEAGIPVNEVLQLATIRSAENAGQESRLGSISVGKESHMHLVKGNPVDDLSNLYRVSHVIKGTKVMSAAEILRSQGFVPFD